MKDNYLSVTALTKYIKRKLDLDTHLQEVWLRGEISNFKHHNRGHMYMTLKDEKSRIQAVMFAGNNRFLKFYPESGMKVLIRGNVSVYETAGQYQLYIREMEPDGIGALHLAYEQLKNKLDKEGYFSADHKRKIPAFPKRIGIITSPTGAAIRDMITTIERRYPIVEIVVIPVLVQGDHAPLSIKNGIEKANRLGGFDTLIVGRGGGSIEELWSFNEEMVAKAIYESDTPIISAVGHETDTTISDFVADLRAPTPTGAAEVAVPSQIELRNTIRQLGQRLNREMEQALTKEKRSLKNLVNSYAFRYPKELLKQKEQQLDSAMEALDRNLINETKQYQSNLQSLIKRLSLQHPDDNIRKKEQDLNELKAKAHREMKQILVKHQDDLSNLMDKLTLVNPLEIMKRGFALPYDSNGELLKSVEKVKENDEVTVKLVDGEISAKVKEIKENQDDRGAEGTIF